jgi:cadmium resistance protein CadD (predicted permease)
MGIGIVVFAPTSIDDVVVLSAFFADMRLSRRAIVVGQFLGIGARVLASVAAGLGQLGTTLANGMVRHLAP